MPSEPAPNEPVQICTAVDSLCGHVTSLLHESGRVVRHGFIGSFARRVVLRICLSMGIAGTQRSSLTKFPNSLTIGRVGDYMQTLVDVEIDEHAAVEMKQRLTSWLIGQGIIAPELTDCVMGTDGGYAPGTNYRHAVASDSIDLRQLQTNGVAIDAGRQVYWNLELEAVVCPRCGYREILTPRELGRWDTAFNDAIYEWLEGGGGLVACLGCSVRNGLNDWDWGLAPWAFSPLGLTFWNWTYLSEQFIAEVQEFLGGHRLVHCASKI